MQGREQNTKKRRGKGEENRGDKNKTRISLVCLCFFSQKPSICVTRPNFYFQRGLALIKRRGGRRRGEDRRGKADGAGASSTDGEFRERSETAGQGTGPFLIRAGQSGLTHFIPALVLTPVLCTHVRRRLALH